MNINRDYVSLETKFCSVCVFLIVTPSELFPLVFDFSALLAGTTLIEIAVYNDIWIVIVLGTLAFPSKLACYSVEAYISTTGMNNSYCFRINVDGD